MRHAHGDLPPRKSLLLLIVAGVLVSGAALTVWRMTWMAPSWWSPPDPTDEQTDAIAERVEYRVAEQVHLVRSEPEPWWIEVSQDQVNAWLAARLGPWLAHTHDRSWPPEVGPPQVNLESGALGVGLDIRTNAGRRYVVARLVPRVIEGELAITIDGISIGRVTIPGADIDTIVERLETAAPGLLEDPLVLAVIEVLAGRQRIDPVLELHDGRRVRLLDVRCRDGTMHLQCRTVR